MRGLLLAALLLAAPAFAQERPIRLVVPFPPGGGTDVVARVVAQRLGEALGVPVVAENRPGAGGSIGSEVVARAAPDGTTIGIATSSTHPAAVVLQKGVPYDPVRDRVLVVEQFRAQKVLAFRGLDRIPVDSADAGEIIALAGMSEATVADTICDLSVDTPLVAQPVDPPTLSMTFRINDGPFAGQEGDKVQSRVIRERLLREAERNIAIRIAESDDKEAFTVSGRGELQLAILIENMRREGFEITVSRPKVVYKIDEETKQRLEPIEEVIIDVDDAHTGVVVSKLSERRGEMIEMRPSGGGRTRMVFYTPTRGLLGYQSELLSDTRGTAVMNRIFHTYAPYKGEIAARRTGVLISNGVGEATAYSLFYLQDRGPFMIGPQTRVYEGMIVGEHTRDNDLVVNVTQGKKLTNVRASGKDEALTLTPPMRLNAMPLPFGSGFGSMVRLNGSCGWKNSSGDLRCTYCACWSLPQLSTSQRQLQA